MMDLFSELMNMFGSMDMLGNAAVQRDDKKCPVCGHTWDDFRRTGRFGCGECYRTFFREAEQVIRQVHSSAQHMGKIPSKSGAEVRMKRRLEELRRELKEAVAGEDYERAAKLHSEIKKIEGGGLK